MISPSGQVGTSGPLLTFEDVLAFPGLINSHDHLDFNLFERLGNRVYNNYREWGEDIHRAGAASIARVLKIPQPLRIRWGLYKNLLGGITTVVYHGPKADLAEDLVSVFQEAQSFHSVSGEKGWKRKLLFSPGRERPIVIHIGEGTDASSFEEINDLLRWNLTGREVIGIHGVAMNEQQAASFRALVWCPDSNYFLLDKTARIDLLKSKTSILFGTDSTLSASWNIWEHIRLARQQGMISDAGLLDALTLIPAAIWGLKDRGRIEEGASADIVIARRNKDADSTAGSTVGSGSGRPGAFIATPWDSFYASNPEDILLVMHRGNIRLFDNELLDQLNAAGFPINDFHKVNLAGADTDVGPGKSAVKFVQGDLPGLMNEIRKYHPSVSFPVS
jgi:cytosine/adenosine deaminase-related metal-dependent hydrolase